MAGTAYEAKPSDVRRLVDEALDSATDPVERYHRASVGRALYAAAMEACADERALACLALHESGLSYADIARVVSLGTRGRAQQLVESGRKARERRGPSWSKPAPIKSSGPRPAHSVATGGHAGGLPDRGHAGRAGDRGG